MKKLLSVIVFGLLTGCATPHSDRTYKAVGQDSRAQFLILHYTHVDFPTSLKLLTEGEVSSHYLVSSDPPTIYQLVDEKRRLSRRRELLERRHPTKRELDRNRNRQSWL